MISTHLLVHNGGEKHTAIRNIKIGAFFWWVYFWKRVHWRLWEQQLFGQFCNPTNIKPSFYTVPTSATLKYGLLS